MPTAYLKFFENESRQYPYAESVLVLANKDTLFKVETSEETKEPTKPGYKLVILAIICFLPLGLFSLIHYMRALSAFGK